MKEILNKRNRYSKTFKKPNGEYNTKIYPEPIHYLDNDGIWKDIQSILSIENDKYINRLNNFTTGFRNDRYLSKFSGIRMKNNDDIQLEFSIRKIQIDDNEFIGSKLKFDECNLIDNNHLEYKINGVKIISEVQNDFVKNYLKIDNKCDHINYELELHLTNLKVKNSSYQESGITYYNYDDDLSFTLVDKNTNEELFKLNNPFIKDSSGNFGFDYSYFHSLRIENGKLLYNKFTTSFYNKENYTFPLYLDYILSPVGLSSDLLINSYSDQDDSNAYDILEKIPNEKRHLLSYVYWSYFQGTGNNAITATASPSSYQYHRGVNFNDGSPGIARSNFLGYFLSGDVIEFDLSGITANIDAGGSDVFVYKYPSTLVGSIISMDDDYFDSDYNSKYTVPSSGMYYIEIQSGAANYAFGSIQHFKATYDLSTRKISSSAVGSNFSIPKMFAGPFHGTYDNWIANNNHNIEGTQKHKIFSNVQTLYTFDTSAIPKYNVNVTSSYLGTSGASVGSIESTGGPILGGTNLQIDKKYILNSNISALDYGVNGDNLYTHDIENDPTDILHIGLTPDIGVNNYFLFRLDNFFTGYYEKQYFYAWDQLPALEINYTLTNLKLPKLSSNYVYYYQDDSPISVWFSGETTLTNSTINYYWKSGSTTVSTNQYYNPGLTPGYYEYTVYYQLYDSFFSLVGTSPSVKVSFEVLVKPQITINSTTNTNTNTGSISYSLYGVKPFQVIILDRANSIISNNNYS